MRKFQALLASVLVALLPLTSAYVLNAPTVNSQQPRCAAQPRRSLTQVLASLSCQAQ